MATCANKWMRVGKYTSRRVIKMQIKANFQYLVMMTPCLLVCLQVLLDCSGSFFVYLLRLISDSLLDVFADLNGLLLDRFLGPLMPKTCLTYLRFKVVNFVLNPEISTHSDKHQVGTYLPSHLIDSQQLNNNFKLQLNWSRQHNKHSYWCFNMINTPNNGALEKLNVSDIFFGSLYWPWLKTQTRDYSIDLLIVSRVRPVMFQWIMTGRWGIKLLLKSVDCNFVVGRSIYVTSLVGWLVLNTTTTSSFPAWVETIAQIDDVMNELYLSNLLNLSSSIGLLQMMGAALSK